MTEQKYGVRYEDNTGPEDAVSYYDTAEQAEAAIEEELDEFKEYLSGRDYDYADFGSKTEIWECGGNEYASWERLWW